MIRLPWKWPESVFLVLTKRKADSEDENGINMLHEKPCGNGEHAQFLQVKRC